MASKPDFKARAAADFARLGEVGAQRIIDSSLQWNLAPVLKSGGTLIFPHLGIEACGHQTAAVVRACLDSGARRVLALGVLHALTDELEQARARVAAGEDPACERSWGIQGPGLPRRQDWKDEFSLDSFQFLWQHETRRRGIPGPELVIRFPYLAGGRPQRLWGIEELREIARDAAVVATMDPFHHGIGYGNSPEESLPPQNGGLELARQRIGEGLQILEKGDYWGYNGFSVSAKSDGRDVGQVLRYLRGSQHGEILDLVCEDMAGMYQQPAPTWVAGALVALNRDGC